MNYFCIDFTIQINYCSSVKITTVSHAQRRRCKSWTSTDTTAWLTQHPPVIQKNALEANMLIDEQWKMADWIKNKKCTYRQMLCKNMHFTEEITTKQQKLQESKTSVPL